MVGAADVYSLPFSADDHRFGFMVIVDPDHRRRGIGTALHSHIVAGLDLGPVDGWESAAWEREPSGSAFLEGLGFEVASVHQMSELALGSVDTAGFGSVIDSVESSGVEFLSLGQYLDAVPDADRELYDLALELNRDVPWYEEVAKPPLEVWRAEFLDSELILKDAFTVALADGRLIGQSALMRDAHDHTVLRTGLTGVRDSYRRRGIARAMKMRAIEQATSLPAVAEGLRILTGNAAENPMLDLNLELGFVKQPAWSIYTKDARTG